MPLSTDKGSSMKTMMFQLSEGQSDQSPTLFAFRKYKIKKSHQRFCGSHFSYTQQIESGMLVNLQDAPIPFHMIVSLQATSVK